MLPSHHDKSGVIAQAQVFRLVSEEYWRPNLEERKKDGSALVFDSIGVVCPWAAVVASHQVIRLHVCHLSHNRKGCNVNWKAVSKSSKKSRSFSNTFFLPTLAERSVTLHTAAASTRDACRAANTITKPLAHC